MSEFDELYVMARRVLLDVLGALGDHRDAIVLVGAQAVYLRVGDADLAITPYTTDGDLVIDPAVLDRLVHNAYTFDLKGPSRRKNKD